MPVRPMDKLLTFPLFPQTLSFSDETKDAINLALLDDVAWCQIQKLSVRKRFPHKKCQQKELEVYS